MNAVSIHKDNFEILRDCSDADLGLLLRALMADVLEEPEISLPSGLSVIRKYISNQNTRFSKKQAENGKSRSLPNGNQNAVKTSQTSQTSQSKPNEPTVSVTVSETKEDNGRSRSSAREREAAGYYLQRVNATPSLTTIDLIGGYEDDLSTEVVKHAIDIALDERKTQWTYIRGILQSYTSQGVKCLADVVALEDRWKAKKQKAADDKENSSGNIFLDIARERGALP